jgi:FixJ family two-component response regulator
VRYVASLGVRGLQNREIAGRVSMSVRTVEAHLTRISASLAPALGEPVHRHTPSPESDLPVAT